jgi:hypothetical protein
MPAWPRRTAALAAPPFRHFRGKASRNRGGLAPILPAMVARLQGVAGDSPAPSRISTMIRPPDATGFDGLGTPVASSRLTRAVAASLAISALSLCLIVTLTVLATKVTMAMPIPA